MFNFKSQLSEDYGKHPYRVVASYPPRDPYPKYKMYNNPAGWHVNASLFLECKTKGDKLDNVDIKLYEMDSDNCHNLNIFINEEGNLQCRLTQQVQVQE